jgi:membrane dipeptidase
MTAQSAQFGFGPMASVSALALLTAVCLALAAPVRASEPTGSTPTIDNVELATRVARLLAETPLIDGHNDLPENLREFAKNHHDRIDISKDTGHLEEPLQTDIPRLRQGKLGGVFWSAFVSTDLDGAPAVQVLFEQIDLVHRFTERYPEAFTFARSASDIERIHRSGKIASLIGIEGGHAIGNSLAVLRQAYGCGARYLTLTHFRTIAWADAATDKPVHGGLTPFGFEVIREMNRLGMLVDLSHVSDKVMLDVLNNSEAPPVFTHSSARALCNHVRNVPDDILELVAKRNGLVMVNFAPGFISEEVRKTEDALWTEGDRLRKLYGDDRATLRAAFAEWRAENPSPSVTVSQVADHIEHIRKVAGIDHVGIGSDFDGIGATPVGLENVSCFPNLIAELLRRGYSDGDVKKITGGNLLRVFRQAEKVAERLQKERRPSEALIDELDPRPPAKHTEGSK